MMPLAQLDGSHRSEAGRAGAEVVADLHVTVHWHRHTSSLTSIPWVLPDGIHTTTPPKPDSFDQGVTKRCRLSYLTNSTRVYEPKCGGWGLPGFRVSANEYSCAHKAQIHFGDLTPYLIFGFDAWFRPIACRWETLLSAVLTLISYSVADKLTFKYYPRNRGTYEQI